MNSNPFQSPVLPETEPPSNGAQPSLALLVVCLVIGNVVNFATSFSFYFDPEYSLAARLGWLPADLCYGLIYSLGLTLLIHALYYQRLFDLMPGHWRLITYLGMFSEYVSEYLPWIVISILLAIFVLNSRESENWKLHTWLCILVYLADYGAQHLSLSLQTMSVDDAVLITTQYAALWYALLGVNWVIYVANFVIVLVMIMAIRKDIRQEVVRDTYHYLGLALIVITPTLHNAYTYVLQSQLGV
ncbi:hypothetical protein C5Y96_05060 [Blastopirellula marina]|uniref:Uncharacterized protein n=1 Tax=Blastopirellula marina TaxID=124 RepID=A0A2S8G446_9BACT|nr:MULTISPECIES: hypothetical protein [Pirellulaceae]PQO39229.1 hypothetical protein C5Y96_05060 [Blastopirellula marina]RCS55537.1 hypothetical protein DTL36_05070 [Bremerella cremea]